MKNKLMETTPSKNRFSISRNGMPTAVPAVNEASCEEKMYVQLENGDSPVHVACTQESNSDVDVVWDWNSPQAKPQPRRTLRRPASTRSPKIPLKRHPSNNQIKDFEKLREELRNLKEAISVPDDEESLVLSPVQEQEYKDVNPFQNEMVISPHHDNFPIPDDDLFDDSTDEQLLLASQRIERELCSKNNSLYNNNENIVNGKCATSAKASPIKQEFNLNSTQTNNMDSSSVRNNEFGVKIADDSFDNILGTLNTESNEVFQTIFDRTITKLDIKNKHVFSRTKSENQHNIFRQSTGKVEFHRTQSFESTLEHTKEIIPQSKLAEIERKRQQAVAKLGSKRKQDDSGTPTKCTPQEIEQKRLQALAKREAKRQQEIIERKRRDALKRLELSRQKNATIVKSSLTKRL